MPANSPSRGQLTGAGTRVHGDRLLDDEAIAEELADGLARVCVGDLVDFVRVQPDFALTAARHGGCQALLRAKIDPTEIIWSALVLTAWNIDIWCGGVVVGRRFAPRVYGEGRGGGGRWWIASGSKNLVHQV